VDRRSRRTSGRQRHRRHWQVLNTLSTGHADASALIEALRPFWTEGTITLDEVMADIGARGWTRSGDGGCELTLEGVAAHAEVAAEVGATRRRILDGLTPDDYENTVRVLRAMSANLERGLVQT